MKYKLSKYIYYHQIKEDVICFNLLYKYSITIPFKNYKLIETYKNDVIGLSKINKHLFSLLYKTGFIIDSNIDEFKLIKSKYYSEIFKNTTYRLTILPTLDCNFKCWYCYEKKEKSTMSLEMQNRIFSHLKNKISIEGISRIQLDWFGGEPLLEFNSVIFPLSKKIIEFSNENNITFSNQITTNGYLLNEEIIEKLNKIKLNNFQITLDGNKKAHNKIKKGDDSYSMTIRNINMLCDIVINPEILIRINYTDESLKNCEDIILDIPDRNRTKLKVSFQKVWQLLNDNDSSEELKNIKQKFKNAGFSIFDYEIMDVQVCYADRIGQAVISYDGNVFKCTARDFNKKNADGFLDEDGVIQWNTKKHSTRFGINAFEKYKECRECEILPACYGPCSQKVLETNLDNFKKICNYEGIISTIQEILERDYEKMFI